MTDLALLHGWGMSPRVWEPVIEGLSVRYRVHNLALPGYGDGSTACPPGDSGQDLLDHWSAQCLAMAPEGSLWIAWSLGALVLMNAALMAASRIRAMVLVAATPCFTRRPGWPSGIDGDVMRDVFRGVQGDDRRALHRFVLLQAGESDDARALGRSLSRSLVETGTAPVKTALEAGLRVLGEVDLRARLPAIDVPVRVIHGGQDRVVPVEAGGYIADHVPGADLVRLETGHAPFVSQPAAFTEAVLSWR